MWIFKVYKESKSSWTMGEKSTKADTYRVPPVAQRVTELHKEPGRTYWEILSSIYSFFLILISGIDYCRQHTEDNRPAA